VEAIDFFGLKFNFFKREKHFSFFCFVFEKSKIFDIENQMRVEKRVKKKK
jgi:hypothetical protein